MGDTTYTSHMIHFPLRRAPMLAFDSLGLNTVRPFHGPWLVPAWLGGMPRMLALAFRRFERPMRDRLPTLPRGSAGGFRGITADDNAPTPEVIRFDPRD
jgi:hypothetical protein